MHTIVNSFYLCLHLYQLDPVRTYRKTFLTSNIGITAHQKESHVNDSDQFIQVLWQCADNKEMFMFLKMASNVTLLCAFRKNESKPHPDKD